MGSFYETRTYTPARDRYDVEEIDPKSPRSSVSFSRARETLQETRAPRVVEETRSSYERIQELITQLSGIYGVTVRKAAQVDSGKQSSPRPHFLDEAAYLAEHVEGIRFPETVRYQDYQGDPSTEPVVLKNETTCKGQQKYLLENRRQLQRFRQWMEAHGKPADWIAQEFIETPASAPSSFRVLVDCTGHIVTSQICYGPPNSMGMRKDAASRSDSEQDPAKLLEQSGSDYFLNARAIASNHMLVKGDDSTIGGRITLNPLPISHPYSRTEKHILREHGLDADSPVPPQLPPEVARVASGIGKALGMKGKHVHELVLGVDVIQKRGTDEFYVLEANRRPSMVAVRDMLGSADSVKEIDAWRWLINGIMQRVTETQNR